MEFIYGKAPNYYIGGVPGYKAGEWPGIKSCKFANTRRIIHPKDQGIIYNEHEPVPPPRRRLLGPSPSPEYIFRPCIKMVTSVPNHIPKISSLKPIQQEVTITKPEPEKRHKFDYLETKNKERIERERQFTMSNFVKNEMKMYMNGGGCVKGFSNLSNKYLLALRFGRKGNKMEIVSENEYGIIDREQMSRDKKRDLKYVNKLTEWDNKTLSKYKIKQEVTKTEEKKFWDVRESEAENNTTQ